MAATDPITIVDLAVADRTAGWATYYAAAMAILFVFLAAQFGIVSIHAERRTKTLARMLAAPLPWWSIVAGKVIVSMVLAHRLDGRDHPRHRPAARGQVG